MIKQRRIKKCLALVMSMAMVFTAFAFSASAATVDQTNDNYAKAFANDLKAYINSQSNTSASANIEDTKVIAGKISPNNLFDFFDRINCSHTPPIKSKNRINKMMTIFMYLSSCN